MVKSLVRRGALTPWAQPHLKDIYVVTAPFADLLPLEEEQLLQEANPEGYFCFQTALFWHELSNEFPKALNMAKVNSHSRPPLGTQEDDWIGLSRPLAQAPEAIGQTPVVWAPTRSVRDVGIIAKPMAGGIVWVTDIERTLLDAIQYPSSCLGIRNVLSAWRNASEVWNLDRLISHAEDLEAGPVMRQRIGFLVESLGGQHPVLDFWRENLERGGSLKLVASLPYSATFDERWNLSLNAPSPILHEFLDN